MTEKAVTIVLHSGYSYTIDTDYDKFMEHFNGSHERVFWPALSVFLNKESVAMIHKAVEKPQRVIGD